MIKEAEISIHRLLIDSRTRVDAEFPSIPGSPVAVLHVLDPGDDEARPGLPDGEKYHALRVDA